MKDSRTKLDHAVVVALALTVTITLCSCKTGDAEEATFEPTTTPTIVETTEAVTEPTEIEPPVTEATEPEETEPVETEPEETEPPVILYDVPLDAELQLHIIETAERYGIDPAIIFAMAFRESTYNPDCVGDGGDSYGLMQVQPKWHSERMERLGCFDLLDPYQNVTVAIDYLNEMLEWYGRDVAKALTAYNRGFYEGTITEYAKAVMNIAEGLDVIECSL